MSNKYKPRLEEIFKMSSSYREVFCPFVFNICMNNDEKKDYVSTICKSRDSIIYRIESINWHLESMCSLRIKYDMQLGLCKDEWCAVGDAISMYYMFDNVVFNTISLYDYYATFIALYFMGISKRKLTWNRLASSALGKQNEFSKCWIAKDIISHDRMWASKLQDFRAEIMHYYFDIGKQGFSWTAKQGCMPQSSLILTIPKKLSKMLKFQSEQGGYDNFDLNYGTFEIVHRSLFWINMMTSKIIDSTKNA